MFNISSTTWNKTNRSIIGSPSRSFHSSQAQLSFKKSINSSKGGHATKIAFACGCVVAYFLNRYYDEHQDFSVIASLGKYMSNKSEAAKANKLESSGGEYWKVRVPDKSVKDDTDKESNNSN